MHHGCDTVAHGAFVAPARETGREHTIRLCLRYTRRKKLGAYRGDDKHPRDPRDPMAGTPVVKPVWG